jgi:hypothetical protein
MYVYCIYIWKWYTVIHTNITKKKLSKGKPEIIDDKQYNVQNKIKTANGQIKIYKTLHRKLKTD